MNRNKLAGEKGNRERSSLSPIDENDREYQELDRSISVDLEQLEERFSSWIPPRNRFIGFQNVQRDEFPATDKPKLHSHSAWSQIVGLLKQILSLQSAKHFF